MYLLRPLTLVGASGHLEAGAFLRTTQAAASPDIQHHFKRLLNNRRFQGKGLSSFLYSDLKAKPPGLIDCGMDVSTRYSVTDPIELKTLQCVIAHRLRFVIC